MSGRILGTDGKQYPDRWLSADDRAFLAGAVHHLHHSGVSVRRLLVRIEAEHGIQRSVGWAAGVLKSWRCADCSGGQNRSPEHRVSVT